MYAYILAANKSMPAEIIRLKRCFKEFKNILSAILTSPDGYATRQQKEQLEKLCSEFDDALRKAEGISEKLNAIIQKKSDKYNCSPKQLIDILKGENLYDKWIKDYHLIPSCDIQEIKQFITYDNKEDTFEDYMSNLGTKINCLENKKRQPNIQKEQFPTISSNRISSIPIEEEEEEKFIAKLLNEYLNEAWSGKDFMQSRYELAFAGGKLFKEEIKDWNTNPYKDYINGLLKNLNEHSSFEMKSCDNQTLQSFAAFCQKGDDDIDKLEDYLISNGIGDFRIAFALWGAVFGFAAMPKTLTESLFSCSDTKYISEIYKYIYKQVHGVELEGTLEMKKQEEYKTIPLEMRASITELPKQSINQEQETKPSNSKNQAMKDKLKGCKLKPEQIEEIIKIYEKHNGKITNKFFVEIKQIQGIGDAKIKKIKEAWGYNDNCDNSKEQTLFNNTKMESGTEFYKENNVFSHIKSILPDDEKICKQFKTDLDWFQNEYKEGAKSQYYAKAKRDNISVIESFKRYIEKKNYASKLDTTKIIHKLKELYLSNE
jgi:hypothetical protein